MSPYYKDKAAFRSLNFLNIFLLSVHAVMLIFFTVTGIRLMAYVNVASVLYYVLGFLLLKSDKTSIYIFFAYVEMMFHMFLAVVSTGWEAGFQLYFIGCSLIVFYADYFSVRLGKRHIRGNIYCAVSAVLYLASMVITRRYGSIYNLSESLTLFCLVTCSLVLFVFVAIFFGMLVNLAGFYEKQLGDQATHDKLTGMVNRHYLVDQLEKIYAEQDMINYWIAILDIDDFKGINDKYGHLCGDFVLKSMAETIKEHCGEHTVCRWGGEEFVIIGSDGGPNGKDGQTASVLLEKIRQDVAVREFVYDDKTAVNLTITVGVARYRNGQTVDEWINMADRRLYRGKQTGKNKVVETD